MCDIPVPANRTILLHINDEDFIVESKEELTSEIKDAIEALCRCAYDENSEFFTELSTIYPGKSIYDLDPYDLAELFQIVVKKHVGIDVVFKGIDLEVRIQS